jgi:hypothetical protein
MTKKEFSKSTGLKLIKYCDGEFCVVPTGITSIIDAIGELRYERASEDWWEGNYHVTGSWMCTFTWWGIYVCEEAFTQKDCLEKAATYYHKKLEEDYQKQFAGMPHMEEI